MKITDLIEKKKHGEKLTEEEIRFFVDGYVNGGIPDYQISALLMAVWFCGMDEEETFALTMAMKNSGETLDLSPLGSTIDKHSTGGIGDKLSLIVLPLWRAGGLTIAKMSGRGLGFTGGTIDKLESVPGYETAMDGEDFMNHVRRYGIAVTGQSEGLVPADKKMYALRDITGTVDSLPLIAASVMSKKLATAAENIVLDVKYGEGSFMKTKEDAGKLAELMIRLGQSDGRRMAALLSPMEHPLGYAVGNALEVREAYEFLCGRGSGFLKEDAFALAGVGFVLGGKAKTLSEGCALCEERIASGKAKEAFFTWLRSQGGRFDDDRFEAVLNYPCRSLEISAEKAGRVTDIRAMEIGLAGMELGAGRKKLGDPIDPAAGVLLKKAVGDPVEQGEVLAVLYGNAAFDAAAERVKNAVRIGGEDEVPIKESIEVFIGEKWEILKSE